MLQDLAVTARALADAAVTSTKYAPLSITNAAIGIAAINDANIANLSVGKLQPTSGAATIQATGGLTLTGASGATVTLSGGGAQFSGSVTVGSGISVNGSFNLADGDLTGDLSTVAVNAPLYINSSIYINGTLPVSQGGTGASLALYARANLDVYSKSEVDSLVGGGSAVTSVFGRTGAVSASSGDYSSFYAPLYYYPGQTVNDELYALNNNKANAFSGASGTYSSPTSITVSNGIVTSIS
jgi:hypothetical protein